MRHERYYFTDKTDKNKCIRVIYFAPVIMNVSFTLDLINNSQLFLTLFSWTALKAVLILRNAKERKALVD